MNIEIARWLSRAFVPVRKNQTSAAAGAERSAAKSRRGEKLVLDPQMVLPKFGDL